MPARRPTMYAVRVAALALAPVVAVTLGACGSTTYDAPGGQQPVAADGALACPSTLKDDRGTAVPQKPQGIDGATRLLPQREPVSLVVCGYPVMDVTATTPPKAPFPLRTRTVATGQQRAEVVEAMTWAPRSDLRPRACTSMAGNETAYLVGAAYGDAIVWVAAKADANACSTATNGDFVSGAPLGLVLAETFGTKPRPTVAGESCRARSWGRLGDDRLLAPDGGPTVVICRQGVDGAAHATALDAGRSAEVVAALRALSTRPTGRTCEGSGKASDRRFSLVLRYAAGPAVQVSVDPECDPAVLGPNLESSDAAGLVDLVEQWSPPIPGPDPNGSVSSDGSVSSNGSVAPAAPPVPGGASAVPGSPGGGFSGSTGVQPAPPGVPDAPPTSR